MASLAAVVLLAVFGATLLFPALIDHLTRPLVRLGGRQSQSADHCAGAGGSTIAPALLSGVASGLLWPPWAGP